MNKQPEITAKTRRNIMDAFWLLYSQMDIDKITVGAITKKAGYNRSTFYAYFTDIYDLLDQIENEMVENLSEKFASFFSETLPLDFQVFSGKCAEIFAENGDKLFYLLRHNNKFADKLKKSLLPVVVTYSCLLYTSPSPRDRG